MKLSKVVSICVGAKCLVMFDKVDETGEINQWASDRNACYRLDGIPYLDDRTVFNTLDIPENKRDKMFFSMESMPEGVDVEDFADEDALAEPMGVDFVYGGVLIKPLRTKDGIVYIQSKYLTPFAGDMEFLSLYQRHTPSGETYIVVKIGMLAAAVIFPYDVVRGDDFIIKMEEVLALTKSEREKVKEKDKKGEEMDQQTLSEEPTEEDGQNGEA